MGCKMCGSETPHRVAYKYHNNKRKSYEDKNKPKKQFCSSKCDDDFKKEYKTKNSKRNFGYTLNELPADIIVKTRRGLITKAINGCSVSQSILRKEFGLRALWNKEIQREVRF